MNNTLWIDFLSVQQGAHKSGFPPCSKGEGIQSILDKTYLQEGSTEDRAFAGKGMACWEACAVCTSNVFVGAISNYLMFESNHFLDLANQRFFSPSRAKYLHFVFFSIIK